jgi:hypothetical protein
LSEAGELRMTSGELTLDAELYEHADAPVVYVAVNHSFNSNHEA